ncbi:aldo/keto reductase [Pseudomonas putida]|uniref:aldo/keto reductase n=1 Tax=Pseudomonas putida TaxID=303 RepID=UPI003F2E7B68
MDNQQSVITLNDGNTVPQLGLGVWKATQDEARDAVATALRYGYRHVDTAAVYENEQGVGAGIRASGIPRDDVFVTTKIWNAEQGLKPAGRALDESLQRLKLDHVDLLLIHWPAPKLGLFVETWQALIEAKAQGKVRSIGVSNFNEDHLQTLINETGVTPVLNQIELHPYFQQTHLRAVHQKLTVRTQSWSPLSQGAAVNDPQIIELAGKYGRSPAQVILRWHLQSGLIAIPKSVTPARIEENFQVFDFNLDAADMAVIDGVDKHTRLGPDPSVFA